MQQWKMNCCDLPNGKATCQQSRLINRQNNHNQPQHPFFTSGRLSAQQIQNTSRALAENLLDTCQNQSVRLLRGGLYLRALMPTVDLQNHHASYCAKMPSRGARLTHIGRMGVPTAGCRKWIQPSKLLASLSCSE